MDGRKKSSITCVPCHKAKRGCVGPFPCQRCVAGHKEADCIVYEARKRGPLPRKRRASDARSDFADRALVGKDAIVADLLVSYASAALSERPGDIASLFGLSFPFGYAMFFSSSPLCVLNCCVAFLWQSVVLPCIVHVLLAMAIHQTTMISFHIWGHRTPFCIWNFGKWAQRGGFKGKGGHPWI